VLPSATITQSAQLTMAATGFAPGEEVVIAATEGVKGETKEIGSGKANQEGALDEMKITLPEWLTSGPHVLSATGSSSERRAETPLYVRAEKLWVQIGSYAVKHLDKLGFIAGGFAPGEKIEIYLQDLPAASLGTADTDLAGNTVWTEVTMPLVAAGEHTLVLQGEQSGLELTQVITVTPFTPQFDLDPYAGLPGTKVVLYGQGFAPGEKISVYVGDAKDATLTITANDGGGFERAGTIVIPRNAKAGTMDVVLAGNTSNAKVSREFTVVAPYPFGGLSTFSGPPGSTVFFDGLGFAAEEKVDIYLGGRGGTLVAVAQTDTLGRFRGAGPAQVPPDVTRDVTFTFVGESSGVESSTTFKLILPPSIELAPK
jgi:hypothetical protein